MGEREDLLNAAVGAYEEMTGQTPDTRDFVAIENAVDGYLTPEGEEE